MKHFAAVAALALVLVPCPSAAHVKGAADAQPPPERIDVEPDARIRISNINGRIEVRVWEQAAVRLGATYDQERTEVTFVRDGSGAAIQVRPRHRDGHGGTADLVVDVPHAAKLDINSVNADVRVTTGGDLGLSTVNGDVEIDTTGRRVRLETVNGDVEIRASDLELRARTVSGELEVKAKTITELNSKSVSGHLKIEAEALGAGRHSVKSHSGDVELRLPSGAPVFIEVKAFGGRRTLGDPDGDAKVKVKTFSGDVDLVGAKTSCLDLQAELPPGFVAVL